MKNLIQTTTSEEVKTALLSTLNELKIQDGKLQEDKREIEVLAYQLKTGKIPATQVINYINSIPGFDVEVTGIQIRRENA